MHDAIEAVLSNVPLLLPYCIHDSLERAREREKRRQGLELLLLPKMSPRDLQRVATEEILAAGRKFKCGKLGR